LVRYHKAPAPLEHLFSLAEAALQNMLGWSEGDRALVETAS